MTNNELSLLIAAALVVQSCVVLAAIKQMERVNMAGIDELNAEIGNLGTAVDQGFASDEAALKAEKDAHAADLLSRDLIEADLQAKIAAGADTQPSINALKVIEARIAARNAPAVPATPTDPTLTDSGVPSA